MIFLNYIEQSTSYRRLHNLAITPPPIHVRSHCSCSHASVGQGGGGEEEGQKVATDRRYFITYTTANRTKPKASKPYLVIIEREHPKVHVRPRERRAQHPQAQSYPLVFFSVQIARRWWRKLYVTKVQYMGIRERGGEINYILPLSTVYSYFGVLAVAWRLATP